MGLDLGTKMLNESDPSERFRCPASGTPNRVRKDLHHYPRQIFPVKSLFACTCAWLSCQTGGFPGNRYDTSLFCSLLRPGNPSQFAGQKMVGDIEFGLRRGKSKAEILPKRSAGDPEDYASRFSRATEVATAVCREGDLWPRGRCETGQEG